MSKWYNRNEESDQVYGKLGHSARKHHDDDFLQSVSNASKK